MGSSLLAHLTLAGVIQRTPGPAGSYLRVTPRFLAHAEGTAGRLRLTGHEPQTDDILRASLTTWDDYRSNIEHGTAVLCDVMEARDQLGSLTPMFTTLEQFAVAA